MNVRILYFARLREDMGLAQELFDLPAAVGDVTSLRAQLVARGCASAAAAADLSPIRGPAKGSPVNRKLTKLIGAPQPALASFLTRSLEPYWLEPHLGDVGHGFILGPTGMGKTVLGGWMVLRWMQYPNAQAFVFDKDGSLRKAVLLAGGQYLGEDGQLQINPFHGIESDADWAFMVDFTVMLLEATGEALSPTDVNAVATACQGVRALPPSDRRLRTLLSVLPKQMGERLMQWVGGGRFATYFEHEEDGMSLSTLTGIAMDAVLRYPPAAEAFMHLAFHRIDKLIRQGGPPTYVHVEEGWFMLANPSFEQKFDDWQRVARKKETVVVLSTQALGELAESKTFNGFAAAPNRFFLPNPGIGGFRDLYRDKLGLTDEQIHLIATARPKGEVVLVRDGRARILNTHMTPEALALLAVDETDELFDRIMNINLRGTALAEAIDHKCAACQVMLRPQVDNEVRTNQQIVICDSCHRILYFVAEHQPPEEAEPAADGRRRRSPKPLARRPPWRFG